MPSRHPLVVPKGESRINSLQMIEELIRERNEMLVLFSRVAGVTPFEHRNEVTGAGVELGELCHRLLDYTSDAKARVYDRILSGTERRRDVATLTRRFYPRIAETTRVIHAFCDRYIRPDEPPLPKDFESDLTLLGEELATRVELEDQIWQELCRLRGDRPTVFH